MKTNPKVAFFTLGCKVNQYDTELLKDLFVEKGYKIVDFKDYADIYVINTCVVTHIAERKSRQNIRKAKKKNPNSIIAVVGCYPQTFPEKVKEIEDVDVFLGTDKRRELIKLIERGKSISKERDTGLSGRYEDIGIKNLYNKKQDRSRHFLKVQEGCERFCSYCIVPYARGRFKSRPIISVIKEAREAVSSGFKELVLTGSNLGAYGQESFYKPDLVDLIRAVTSIDTKNTSFRVRLSSIEPMEISQDLIEEVSSNSKVCPHLHIPLQSADDEVLKRMNRPYTHRDFRNLIDRIKKLIPDICLTTDVIVGFPGEKKKNFKKTRSFLESQGFADLHVFKYSKREKTPAEKFDDQVSYEIKEKRSIELIKLADGLKARYQKKFLGKKLKVLIESEEEGRYIKGLSENYIRVYLSQYELNGFNLRKGELYDAKPYSCSEKFICKIIE